MNNVHHITKIMVIVAFLNFLPAHALYWSVKGNFNGKILEGRKNFIEVKDNRFSPYYNLTLDIQKLFALKLIFSYPIKSNPKQITTAGLTAFLGFLNDSHQKVFFHMSQECWQGKKITFTISGKESLFNQQTQKNEEFTCDLEVSLYDKTKLE